jgi:serine protease inhibitor
MSVVRMLTIVLACALGVAACGGPDGAVPDGSPTFAPVAAELDPGEARRLADAANRFGFDLLAAVAGDGNVITSPISTATLLAMVLAGAEGETAREMADVLHLDGQARDGGHGSLLAQLTGTDDVTLRVANALWTQEGFPVEPDYLGFTRDVFGATAEQTDLGDPGAVDQIDDWVRERTEGRITELAEALGVPDPLLRVVLVNAVYFLGTWTAPFEPEATADEPFTLADGAEVTAPLMRTFAADLAHAEAGGFRMLRLPYGEDGRVVMDVLLPDGSLQELVGTLDADAWRSAAEALAPAVVDVWLPRFELRTELRLNDPLAALGMPRAFDERQAEFTAMSPVEDLYLSAVVHKTFIRVDEEGTEAAAVTGGGMSVTSAPADPPVQFRVDRPFAFTISDTETGAILFLGAVTDPRG